MIVGITGGTGCGKTTALNAFADLGGYIIDCDALYHHLLSTDQKMLSAINARFPGVVTEGCLDRKALGNIVFADSDALNDLNRITHAFIIDAIKAQLSSHKGHIAIDAIALLESGLGKLCDVTVAITAPEADRIQRIVARDGISPDYAKKRIAAQKDQDYFRENCDHILENQGTKEDFYAKCLAFFTGLGIMKTT